MISINRREALFLAAGGVAALAGGPGFAAADIDAVLAEFTGGVEMTAGALSLTAPEIAENGNSVPVSFTAGKGAGAVEILLLAAGNPSPTVARFSFGALSGEATATTRIRLARTQKLMVVAKMADGTILKDEAEVKVTIGGCGG